MFSSASAGWKKHSLNFPRLAGVSFLLRYFKTAANLATMYTNAMTATAVIEVFNVSMSDISSFILYGNLSASYFSSISCSSSRNSWRRDLTFNSYLSIIAAISLRTPGGSGGGIKYPLFILLPFNAHILTSKFLCKKKFSQQSLGQYQEQK